MSEILIPPVNEVFVTGLAPEPGSFDTGWCFHAGDPEYWRFNDTLVKPGGKVLDVGIGLGRSSTYFALNDMSVVGFDTNPENVDLVNEMAADMATAIPFNMKAIEGEANRNNIPDFGEYDTSILAYMHHQDSPEACFDLMDLSFDALKSGGAMWLRTIGRQSSVYQELLHESMIYPGEIFVRDDYVIEHPCGCSGEYKIEPSVFLDPMDVLEFFAAKEAKFVHTQTIPTQGRWNIMFGEDFRQDAPIEVGGMISLLVVKP